MKTYKQLMLEIKMRGGIDATIFDTPEITGANLQSDSKPRVIKTVSITKVHPFEPPYKMRQPGSAQKFNSLYAIAKAGKKLDPIIVRNHPDAEGHYIIIDGHHRFFALRKANKPSISVTVVPDKNIVFGEP